MDEVKRRCLILNVSLGQQAAASRATFCARATAWAGTNEIMQTRTEAYGEYVLLNPSSGHKKRPQATLAYFNVTDSIFYLGSFLSAVL